MLPKEYLNKKFNNLQNKINVDIVDDPLLRLLPEMQSDKEDYSYSNNLEFESLIDNFLIKNQYYEEDDYIYVGKLSNPYPNCYLVSGDDLEGCLICITSGLTENSYIISKYYTLLYESDEIYINEEQLKIYIQILERDIIYRIHQGYGTRIVPGDLLYYVEIILGEKIVDFLNYTASFSAVMDYFNILHEYGHYIWKTIGKKRVLQVLAVSLYVELCEKTPQYMDISQEEILADIIALYILFDGGDLDRTEIMAVLLSVLQLQKMSKADIYTNEYRLDVFYYFFSKYSITFQQDEQEIKSRVQKVQQLFKIESEIEIQKRDQAVPNAFFKLLQESGIEKSTIDFILQDRQKQMKELQNLLKERDQIGEDEFEDFLFK